ncbi:IS4 family transposase [Alienimonas sp. DA493]|uniref:IS4 family transposase n=1 Tax=Alienimonas sp. DA493 TaxID=3373605 RepID=UPI0037551C9E
MDASAVDSLRPARRLPRTYTGFADALIRRHRPLAEAVWRRCRRRLPAVAGDAFRGACGGLPDWTVLAADGTRLNCPRSAANEAGLDPIGKAGIGPQIAGTLLFHVGSSLPWDVRLGPGRDGEQTQLTEMFGDLPAKTLLLADAGFSSCAALRRLATDEHAFLIRAGGNRRLLTELSNLGECEYADGRSGRGQQVWLWPQNLRRAGETPLSLRLIELETDRSDCPNLFLLTNLPTAELSDAQAAELYKLRWGVEVGFRTLKQTLEGRTLRSRTPKRALAEAEWLVLSLWLLGALAAPAVRSAGKAASAWSPSATAKAVRRRMRFAERTGGRWTKTLRADLAACAIDRRPRRAAKQRFRHPQKKIGRPPTPPEVRPAEPAERRRYKAILAQGRGHTLTA